MRFRFHDQPSHRCDRRTDDAVSPTAIFSAGHQVRQHDDGLSIHSSTGTMIATFHGPHAARIAADGGLHVFRANSSTNDSDAPHGTRLAAMNRLHTDFYRRRP
jgi:hypothetical protein